jgi:hypothetical protein
MKPFLTLSFAAPLAAAAVLVSVSAFAVSAKEPPNCAAIAFRPVLSRTDNGLQDAGLYKSRFGRIELKAEVKNGVAERYFVQINGKALAAAPSPFPPTLTTCAQAKRLALPITPEPVCTGDQLTVLIDHSSDVRYVLLYVHRAGVWRFCSAGVA